jgi:hypothetical protein
MHFTISSFVWLGSRQEKGAWFHSKEWPGLNDARKSLEFLTDCYKPLLPHTN